jgi:hypothetical protein
MNYLGIKTTVEEKCDGRTFSAEKHARWINNVRTKIAMDFIVAGFHGLYFLYKEATVKDGSVVWTAENQGKYALPDDFIDDLTVFYDGLVIDKSPRTSLDVIHSTTETGTPQWWRMAGVEFQLVPGPDVAGKVIKLVYNGMPDVISTDNDEDYFMKRFPDLHIFGMAKDAAQSIGQMGYAKEYKAEFQEERAALQLHNRRHWLKAAKMRFQNWDEYEEYKRTYFVQYQET